MDNILKSCFTVPQMAERLQITESSLRSHKMGEIKSQCKNYKWARRIYVDKTDFLKYERKAISQGA